MDRGEKRDGTSVYDVCERVRVYIPRGSAGSQSIQSKMK